MAVTLRVRGTGPLALVEDLGRTGVSAIGIGRSGAADRAALRLANRALAQPGRRSGPGGDPRRARAGGRRGAPPGLRHRRSEPGHGRRPGRGALRRAGGASRTSAPRLGVPAQGPRLLRRGPGRGRRAGGLRLPKPRRARRDRAATPAGTATSCPWARPAGGLPVRGRAAHRPGSPTRWCSRWCGAQGRMGAGTWRRGCRPGWSASEKSNRIGMRLAGAGPRASRPGPAAAQRGRLPRRDPGAAQRGAGTLPRGLPGHRRLPGGSRGRRCGRGPGRPGAAGAGAAVPVEPTGGRR